MTSSNRDFEKQNKQLIRLCCGLTAKCLRLKKEVSNLLTIKMHYNNLLIESAKLKSLHGYLKFLSKEKESSLVRQLNEQNLAYEQINFELASRLEYYIAIEKYFIYPSPKLLTVNLLYHDDSSLMLSILKKEDLLNGPIAIAKTLGKYRTELNKRIYYCPNRSHFMFIIMRKDGEIILDYKAIHLAMSLTPILMYLLSQLYSKCDESYLPSHNEMRFKVDPLFRKYIKDMIYDLYSDSNTNYDFCNTLINYNYKFSEKKRVRFA